MLVYLYEIIIRPELVPIFDDMKIKDPKSYENIKKKIEQIAITSELNPNHCKNLRAPLQKYKRVHVNKSFVLVFQVDKKNKKIVIFDYDHHKKIYKKTYN